jgi:hypothetical protein
MGCDYKISGEVSLRQTPEVIAAIEYLKAQVLGEDHVEVSSVDENTLELRLDYDDATTIHTPEYVKGFLESIAPAVIGSGAFDIATSGDHWTEWIGDPDAVGRDKSLAALATIEVVAAELLPGHFARAIEYLQKTHAKLAG